jgi:short-subunit dehydrogenase
MRGHAIVVGASSGLGAAIGAELRGRGWSVTGIARRPVAEVSADRSLSCDVTDEASLRRVLGEAAAAGGAVDALVWCAGTPVMGRTLSVPPEAARSGFETTFWAMQSAVREVLPAMIKRRRGTVLAVLSLAALRAIPHEAYYAAAKAAAARWLECLSLEIEGTGVQVKGLYPGFVDTGFLERGGWWGLHRPPRVRGSDLTPADVARAAADLLGSSRSRAVLGWRERTTLLADRISPALYDRLLRVLGRTGDGG